MRLLGIGSEVWKGVAVSVVVTMLLYVSGVFAGFLSTASNNYLQNWIGDGAYFVADNEASCPDGWKQRGQVMLPSRTNTAGTSGVIVGSDKDNDRKRLEARRYWYHPDEVDLANGRKPFGNGNADWTWVHFSVCGK